MLSDGALALVGQLHEELDDRRRELLDAREAAPGRARRGRQRSTSSAAPEDFTVAPVPDALADRRVEITGPTTRKMVINALNSGARGFMADFEDSNSPYWANMVGGQVNLADAVRGSMEHEREAARSIASTRTTPCCSCARAGCTCPSATSRSTAARWRARSWTSASTCTATPRRCSSAAAGPYFYIPKLESAREAALWRDAFLIAEHALGLDRGTIKATVLIETVPAAFEMDAILYELRDHAAGLNAGRWDYIFSMIKRFRSRPDFVLPDRSDVTMTVPFMHAYSELLVQDLPRAAARTRWAACRR